MSLALNETSDNANRNRKFENNNSNDYDNDNDHNNRNKFELLQKNDSFEYGNIEKIKYKDKNNKIDYNYQNGNKNTNQNNDKIPLIFHANEEYENKIQVNRKNIDINEKIIPSNYNMINDKDNDRKKEIIYPSKIENKIDAEKNEKNKKNEKSNNNFSVSEVVAKVLENLKSKKNSDDDNDKKFKGQRRKFLDEETERVSRIMLGTLGKSNR